MKAVLVMLGVLLCSAAQADVQTWTFKDVQLVGDPDEEAGTSGGPEGQLTGWFSYDTATKSVTDFSIDGAGTSYTPGAPASASVPSDTKLVFDEGWSPAMGHSLLVLLTKDLGPGNAQIPLSTDSAIYSDYGFSKIRVTGGFIEMTANAVATSAAVPEPETSWALLVGVGAMVAGRRLAITRAGQ
jgi:hypothetical protein